jgi:REG-2-like HAD superfamily hydrolase
MIETARHPGTQIHVALPVREAYENMIHYSTIVFDAGGTLLQLNYELMTHTYVETASALGIWLDAAQTRAVIEQLESELPAWQQSRAVSLEQDNGREFWNNFYTAGFRRLGVAGDVAAAVNEIRERFQRAEFETLFADVLPTLDAFAARGTPMGILSNFSANLEDILRRLGVHRYFKFFVVSAIAGVEKPDPKIFDLAVRASNRPREEIVYVGDSVFHDIDGARNAGIAAILVDRRNRHALREFNGARVKDLRELVR